VNTADPADTVALSDMRRVVRINVSFVDKLPELPNVVISQDKYSD